MDMLYAAVEPLVWSTQMYQDAYGEDDPEELRLMQLEDQEQARAIADVLQDLFFLAAPSLLEPRATEGPQEEVGPVAALHELRKLAAAEAGYQVDDYYEGRVPAGHLYQHLINHSDGDGHYLPQDFPQPFWVEEVSIGSAPALLRELAALRPALARLYPAEMATVATDGAEDVAGGVVRVWQVLQRLCRSSLELDLPLTFG